MPHPVSALAGLCLAFASTCAVAADPPLPQLQGYDAPVGWRQPVAPVRIADHTWQIGTQELTSLLIRTDAGAILIDGGLPQEADMLLAHMRALGVAPGELKFILHTHAHIDHVGPLAALKRATGATLVSNAESAWMLAHGGFDDIHFGDGFVYPPVQVDRLLQDGETVVLGTTRLTVHFTPGHTPGGMSWTWNDSKDGRMQRMAYVDSLSAPGYHLLDNARYPHIVDDFRRSFAIVRALPCDVMVSPHATRDSGWNFASQTQPHEKNISCREYADEAEKTIDQMIAEQRGQGAR